MSYRQQSDFDRPTAESIQRSRRTFIWLFPLLLMQQGFSIFRSGIDLVSQLLDTTAWAVMSLSILWMLFAWPMRWLSERDQAVLNDEHSRAIAGDASRWGMAALVAIGTAMMFAQIWYPLKAGPAIFGLINGSLIVACARYAWLNRGEPDEDE